MDILWYFLLMLYCHTIENPDQKESLYREFNGQDALWVVNDLESKFWVQSFLQKTEGPVINSDRVLRASELWQKLLLLQDPSWQPLSGHISEFLIEKWMDEILREKQYRISSKDRGRAYQTIGQILPLIGHFQGEDIMEQWFSEKLDAKERWQDWYEMGRTLWFRFLEKKIIPQEWMKGVLINEDLSEISDKPIVVDLAIQIDDVESELFLNLSRNHDVHMVIPKAEEEKEAYQNLISRSQLREHTGEFHVSKRTFKKLPSNLAEVKEAVSSIRRWLEEGAEPSSLAVVSPQIENYWPTLYEHFLVEGILVNKDKSTPLSQFPVYQSWLSQLRLACRKLLKGDPEQIVFAGQENPLMEYREFQTLFSNVYDVEDLKRKKEMEKATPPAIDTSKLYTLNEFLDLTIQWVPASSLYAMDILLEDLDSIFALGEGLTFEKWVEFFEKYFSRNEKKLVDGAESGVQVLSLMAAQNPKLQKVVLLGMSEANLVEAHDTALHWTDIESIKINFGFNLPHTDRHVLLDELRWLETKNVEEWILTHGETDFSGQFQSPSLYWLRGAMQVEQTELCSPGSTRWDMISQQNPRTDLPWEEFEMEECESGIQRDKGLLPTKPVPYTKPTLSASSIDQYYKCPFKYFAAKGLNLQDDPLLDLDIDPRSKGSLLHKVCEIIVTKKKWTLNEKKILELVDQCRESENVPVYTEEIWQFLRPFYLKAIQAFLKFEVEWRNQHPNTETLAVEQKIKTHIRLTEDSIVFDANEGVPFRGYIDRIDKDEEGHLVVVDYKTSSASLSQYTSWVKKGRIQLVLYALALMEGVLGDDKRDVVGAFYYALNKPERRYGYVLENAPEDFISGKPIKPEKYEEIINGTRELVFHIIQDLQAGRIEPHPRLDLDEKLCTNCEWNQLCRYPSLNL